MCFIALAPRLHGFEPAQYTFGGVYESSSVFKRLFKNGVGSTLFGKLEANPYLLLAQQYLLGLVVTWIPARRALSVDPLLEDVTSTAQIAIWTTSKMSRTVMRRPNRLFDRALTISYGLALNTCRTGTIPNRKPLSNARTKATM